MYVITQAYNDYDQHGEYLVAVFFNKPSVREIHQTLKCSHELAKHIETGGGRKETEDNWYYMTPLEVGKLYQHKN